MKTLINARTSGATFTAALGRLGHPGGRLISAGFQRVFSGFSAGAQRGLKAFVTRPSMGFWRYGDCFLASEVFSPWSTQHRRANCEGAPKVDGRRSEGGKGARKVDGRCFGPPARCGEFRGWAPSCSKATSEAVRKVDGRRFGRYRRRSEGGRLRPFDHLIWG
jgi:hypothetical protein